MTNDLYKSVENVFDRSFMKNKREYQTVCALDYKGIK